VLRQLLTESILLSLVGGVLGVLFAFGSIRLIVGLMPEFYVPNESRVTINLPVLLFSLAVSLITGIVFGLVPALQATRVNLVDALRGTRAPLGGRGRLRSALLVTQIALSFVLLVSSGLLFRSLRNAAAPESGVDAGHVAIASFGNLRSFGYDAARVERFHRDWLDAVRTLPGVEQAALASFVGERRGFRVPGRTDDADLTVHAGVVSDGYFATMRQAIIAGRDFTAAPSAVPVAIVNRAFATRYFPNEIAVGRRIGLGEDLAAHEIIGVVVDVRGSSLGGGIEPLVYLQGVPGTLRVRTSGAASAMLAHIQRIGQRLERNLPPYSGRTGEEEIAASLAPQRIVQAVVTTAGVIALLLAAGGLYGLLTYSLEMRLKEVGVRITLGATAGTLFGLIVAGVARLTAIGIVMGVALAVGVTRFARAMLYGVSPTDVLTFASVSALLLLVTLAAGWMTVRQGFKVDPVALLRE
jgi:predicted permease